MEPEAEWSRELNKSFRERVKQLRMEWLFDEPCTYEDDDMSDWRAKLIQLDPNLPELHKKILLEGPTSLGQSWILSGLRKRFEDMSKDTD